MNYVFSFNKYKKICFYFWLLDFGALKVIVIIRCAIGYKSTFYLLTYWLLPEKFSFCPKIVALSNRLWIGFLDYERSHY